MRVTIIANGTRGDVQPYVALGVGLHAAGHDVCVATHAAFESLVRSYGLSFSTLAGDPQAILRSRDGRALLDNNRNVFLTLHQIIRLILPDMQQSMADCLRACQGTDAVIASVMGVGFGFQVAEKLRIPLVRAFNAPVSPTRAYPAAFVPAALRLGGRFNLWTHQVSRQIYWLIGRSQTNRLRRTVLGLPPLAVSEPFGAMDRWRWPLLYGYSAAVVPPPPDWGDWVHVTGYWFLDRPPGWQPPPGLVAFLAAGPPPVYVGFGSMSNRAPEETARLVVQALARAGQRGVLSTGWGGLAGAVSDAVYAIEGVPHDWLFPQMAAAVHHGGAGTTAAALRAGIPSVIIPFFADQRFWGQRVHALGVGTQPLQRAQLTVDALAFAIGVATTDPAIGVSAAAMGRRIRAEDGIGRAVETFQVRLSTRSVTRGG